MSRLCRTFQELRLCLKEEDLGKEERLSVEGRLVLKERFSIQQLEDFKVNCGGVNSLIVAGGKMSQKHLETLPDGPASGSRSMSVLLSDRR